MPTVTLKHHSKKVLRLIFNLLHYFIMRHKPWYPDSQAKDYPTNSRFNLMLKSLL